MQRRDSGRSGGASHRERLVSRNLWDTKEQNKVVCSRKGGRGVLHEGPNNNVVFRCNTVLYSVARLAHPRTVTELYYLYRFAKSVSSALTSPRLAGLLRALTCTCEDYRLRTAIWAGQNALRSHSLLSPHLSLARRTPAGTNLHLRVLPASDSHLGWPKRPPKPFSTQPSALLGSLDSCGHLRAPASITAFSPQPSALLLTSHPKGAHQPFFLTSPQPF
jgi:hypothetical protein